MDKACKAAAWLLANQIKPELCQIMKKPRVSGNNLAGMRWAICNHLIDPSASFA